MTRPPPVEHVRAEDLLAEPRPRRHAVAGGLPRRRKLSGVALAAAGLPLLTLLLHGTTASLSIEGEVLLYLLAVVIVALVGGLAVALVAAVAAALLINYYFVDPLYTLDVAHADQTVALVVFVAVASIVSMAMELAARRARAAAHASAQADTLSALAGAELEADATLRGVLANARDTFSMESIALRRRDHATGAWIDVEEVGWGPPGKEAPLRFDVPIGNDLRMVGRGPAMFAEDQRVLHAFAAAAQTAYEGRRLTRQAEEGRTLATVDRQRTALLAAVGHDLRTPLASIKASVSTLRQADIDLTPEERAELLATIEDAGDRLDTVVGNLLDASRLQTGELSARPVPVALDEVVSAAILAIPDAATRVRVDVPDDLPLIDADPGLLERVLVNLLDNALRHGGGAVEVRAFTGDRTAKMEIADHGPGISVQERERLFEPFQRLDGSAAGVGLGLTVARGFTEAMGGAMVADGTPGGGLTMRLRLPLAGHSA
jgi:two-component system, OmpR family, sensor histidine kinase KdpD